MQQYEFNNLAKEIARDSFLHISAKNRVGERLLSPGGLNKCV
jgi:hypothetical protein